MAQAAVIQSRSTAPMLAALFACLVAGALGDVPPLAQSCAPGDDVVQCSTLRTFAIATGYAQWGFNGGWLTGSSYCSWSGVACDAAGKDVVGLALSTNELWGTLPPELGNLTRLNMLSLPYNSLSGQIPPEIGRMTQLTMIRLSTNLLLGSIPDTFRNLVNLKQLDLSFNLISGNVPAGIAALPSLQALRIAKNGITGFTDGFCNGTAPFIRGAETGWAAGTVACNALPDCIQLTAC